MTINSALMTGDAATKLGKEGVQKTTKNWSTEVAREVATQREKASDVATALSTNGLVDPKKLSEVLARSPAIGLSATEKQLLQSLKGKDELNQYLKDAPPVVTRRLFNTIHPAP